MRDLLKGRPITQGVVAGAIVQIIWTGASAVVGYSTGHFALRSVPTWLAIFVGALVFFLLSISYYLFVWARTRHRTINVTKQPLVLPTLEESKQKLAVEIDETDSQVHVGSPTREIRKIEAKIKLRVIKHVEGPASVQSLHLSLIRYDANRAEIPLVARERRTTVLNAQTMQKIIMDNGWTIDKPISDYRWFIFELDITPLDQAHLSLSQFLRLAVNATGQPAAWEDIRVNSWEDACVSNSSITLKRNCQGNGEIKALLEENNNLRTRIEGLETDLVEDAKNHEEREETLRRENETLLHHIEQKKLVDDALTQSRARINELERMLSNLQEKYHHLESTTTHVRMVAHIQAHSINTYVRPSKFRYGAHDLLRNNPYVDFSFIVVNHSIYDVGLNTTLPGSISFGKRELTEPLNWIRRVPIKHGDANEFTIRQKLTKEDVVHILNGSVTDFFRFGALKIMIGGTAEFETVVIPRPLFILQESVSNADLLKRCPKLDIELKDVTFNWIEETRIGPRNNPRDEPCFITLSLHVTNRRPSPIAIDTFKLTLVVEDNEYVSFAESDVFVRRFVSQLGEEIGEGSDSKNLSHNTPLILIQDKSADGTLQFIFRDLRYIESLTKGISLANQPFRLTLIDKDQERHMQRAHLPAEGYRYVNP
jgi:hypothetical protein